MWASVARFQELWESLPQRQNASQLSGKTKPPPEQAWEPVAEPEPDNREKPSFLQACWCGQIWYMALLWWYSDTGYFKMVSTYCQQEARRVLARVKCICVWLAVVIVFLKKKKKNFLKGSLAGDWRCGKHSWGYCLKYSSQRRKGKQQRVNSQANVCFAWVKVVYKIYPCVWNMIIF